MKNRILIYCLLLSFSVSKAQDKQLLKDPLYQKILKKISQVKTFPLNYNFRELLFKPEIGIQLDSVEVREFFNSYGKYQYKYMNDSIGKWDTSYGVRIKYNDGRYGINYGGIYIGAICSNTITRVEKKDTIVCYYPRAWLVGKIILNKKFHTLLIKEEDEEDYLLHLYNFNSDFKLLSIQDIFRYPKKGYRKYEPTPQNIKIFNIQTMIQKDTTFLRQYLFDDEVWNKFKLNKDGYFEYVDIVDSDGDNILLMEKMSK